jgi:MFS family permease
VNLSAFLLTGGLQTFFFVLPQFLQQPKTTGYGFGQSTVMSGIFVLPATVGMLLMGSYAGVVTRRFGSRAGVIAGAASCSVGVAFLALQHGSPLDVLICMSMFGVGNGLGFAALGVIVVESVSPEQTGAAGGMNTVFRMLGGAIAGQVAATFLANSLDFGGRPSVQGFVDAWTMVAVLLAGAAATGFLIPRRRPYAAPRLEADAAHA